MATMNKEEFNAKVQAIATALGMKAILKTEYAWNIAHMEKGDISLMICNRHSSGHDPHRLEISGNYPGNTQRDDKLPSITVSAMKTPGQIAADIQRRVLPDYMETLKKVQEREAAEDSAHATRMANLTRIAEYIGHKPPDAKTRRNETPYIYAYDIPGLNTITAEYSGRIRMELTNISIDATLKIIDILKTEPKEGE